MCGLSFCPPWTKAKELPLLRSQTRRKPTTRREWSAPPRPKIDSSQFLPKPTPLHLRRLPSAEQRFSQLANVDAIRRDLRQKSVRGAVFSASTGMVDFTVRIGSTAILSRLLVPEHFGLVMMVSAITAIADQLRELGLSTATIQKKDINHREVTNLFWINFGAGIALALLVCALSPAIATFYGEPRLVIITCILSANFITGGLAVQHQALLARRLEFKKTSLVRLLCTLLSTLLAIFLAWKGFGFWALVWREIARNLFLAIGMWIALPWIPGFPYRDTSVRGLVAFGGNLTGANIVASISSGADRFLLGRFWGAEPVALFRQAYQLLLVPMDQLISPLYQVTQPGLGMLQSEDSRYQRYYCKVVLLISLVTMPFSLFVAVFSAEVTHLLLGAKWAACAPIIAILSFSAFIKQPVDSSALILITRHRSRDYFLLSIVQNLTFVALMFAGVHWAAIGVAAADVAATYLLIVPKLRFIFKGSPISLRIYFQTLVRPVVASAVMAGGLLALKPILAASTTAIVLGLGSSAAIVFFAIAWFLLPGGWPATAELIHDVRSGLFRKRA